LGIGVDADELDAAQSGLDHAVDRVDAAATDADDLDHGQVALQAVPAHRAHLLTPMSIPSGVFVGNGRRTTTLK
jgi:hypothetical protein